MSEVEELRREVERLADAMDGHDEMGYWTPRVDNSSARDATATRYRAALSKLRAAEAALPDPDVPLPGTTPV